MTRSKHKLEEMDANDSGTISKEEFESTLQDERVQAYFNAMKLDARARVAVSSSCSACAPDILLSLAGH